MAIKRPTKHAFVSHRAATLDDAEAFLPDKTRHGGVFPDDAEADAEEFVAQATSAEYVIADAGDELVAEDVDFVAGSMSGADEEEPPDTLRP